MKKLLLALLFVFPAVIQAAVPAYNTTDLSLLPTNLLRSNLVDSATVTWAMGAKGRMTATAAGASQTPYTSAHDAAGFVVTNLGNALVYDAQEYGWLPDGTDRSVAASNLLTRVSTNGGGTIYFRAATNTYRADWQLTIPLTGTNQKSFRFTGAGAGPNWYTDYSGSANAAVIDLRYTGSGAKLQSFGWGSLVIDHLTIKDGGSSNNTALLFVNNTTLSAFQNTFAATASPLQTHIILGGTNTYITNNIDGMFQGYGTVVSGNHFHDGGRAFLLQTYANSIVIRDNSSHIGRGECWLESDGRHGAASGNFGLVVSGNLIQMQLYTNGMILRATADSVFDNNSFWDHVATQHSCYVVTNNSFRNTIIKGYAGTTPDVKGGASDVAATTIISSDGLRTVSESGNGKLATELAYGLLVKGTYTGASNYAGALTVNSQFNPGRNVSIGYDDNAEAGVVRAWNTTARSLVLNPTGGNVGIGRTNPAARLDINGTIYTADGVATQPAYSFLSDTNTGLYSRFGGGLTFASDGTPAAEFNVNLFRIPSTANFGWTDSSTAAATQDTYMSRPAQGTILVQTNLILRGSITVTNRTSFPSRAIQTVAAGTAITNNATKAKVAGSGGAVTSTATPTVTTNSVSDGTLLFIMGTDDTNTWTAQDDGSLAGSALQLGAASRVLGKGDILALLWDQTDGVWYEVSFANN